MKPSELRIGNLVTDRNGIIMSVMVITEQYIELCLKDAEADNWSEMIEHVSPIPLDAEWLERLGAKQEIWKLADGISERYWSFENENMPLLTDNLQIDGKDNVPVKYVHQLQTLHFILTGAELNITI